MVEKSFFHMLNICIVNATVMCTSIAGNKNVSNLDFHIALRSQPKSKPCTHGLWERNATRNLRCHTALELTSGQQDYPGKNPNGKKRDCIVCSNQQLGM